MTILVGRPVAWGCRYDTGPLNSDPPITPKPMIIMNNDDNGDDDAGEDGDHDPHWHSRPVPCSRVPNESH